MMGLGKNNLNHQPQTPDLDLQDLFRPHWGRGTSLTASGLSATALGSSATTLGSRDLINSLNLASPFQGWA